MDTAFILTFGTESQQSLYNAKFTYESEHSVVLLLSATEHVVRRCDIGQETTETSNMIDFFNYVKLHICLSGPTLRVWRPQPNCIINSLNLWSLIPALKCVWHDFRYATNVIDSDFPLLYIGIKPLVCNTGFNEATYIKELAGGSFRRQMLLIKEFEMASCSYKI